MDRIYIINYLILLLGLLLTVKFGVVLGKRYDLDFRFVLKGCTDMSDPIERCKSLVYEKWDITPNTEVNNDIKKTCCFYWDAFACILKKAKLICAEEDVTRYFANQIDDLQDNIDRDTCGKTQYSK